jgi:cytoskeletal protein RodZ
MDEKLVQEILDELFSSLEALETRSAAVMEFLKHKGLATDEELAPHFEQAANASNVRWRAARVRINHLLSSAMRPDEKVAERGAVNKKSPHPVPDTTTETDATKDDKHTQDDQKPTGEAKLEEDAGDAEKSENKPGEKENQPAEDGVKAKT